MTHKIYHIDAFTNQVFCGNSACVIMLEEGLRSEIMLKIAAENAVAETAFVLFDKSINKLSLRWFTPDLEMDLCGHATLAAAYVIFNDYPHLADDSTVRFHTVGDIIEVNYKDNILCLHFPLREGIRATLPDNIFNSLNIKPQEVYLSRDYHLVYRSQNEIESIVVNREEFDKINLGTGGVAVSAPGDTCDFVSRFFTPQSTILEDPVTGSAHCTLAPYWGRKLNKNTLMAKQISSRGGDLLCQVYTNKVLISGSAVCYMKGEININ